MNNLFLIIEYLGRIFDNYIFIQTIIPNDCVLLKKFNGFPRVQVAHLYRLALKILDGVFLTPLLNILLDNFEVKFHFINFSLILQFINHSFLFSV